MSVTKRLRRKDEIDERSRTDARDAVADHIEQLMQENKLSGMSYQDIADTTEYSRELVRQVLRDYFEPIDEDVTPSENLELEFDEPMTRAERLYKAYKQGFQDGVQFKSNQRN